VNLLRGMIIDPVPQGMARGRFCFEGELLDAGRRMLTFACPSRSRPERLYWLVLDVDTLECDCRCEDFSMRKGTNAGRYIYGTDQEKADGLQAQVTRTGAGLCQHMVKVRNWVKRRGHELSQQTEERAA
jgi:hypothetical protein